MERGDSQSFAVAFMITQIDCPRRRLPNITAMSKEAHYQIDHNCQSAPIGIQNFVAHLKSKFVPFVDRFGVDLKVLDDSANLILSKLKAC